MYASPVGRLYDENGFTYATKVNASAAAKNGESNYVAPIVARIDWGLIVLTHYIMHNLGGDGSIYLQSGFWRWLWICIGAIIGAGIVKATVIALKGFNKESDYHKKHIDNRSSTKK